MNTLIDVADSPALSRSTWCATQHRRGGKLYAMTSGFAGRRPGFVTLHRVLAGEPPGLHVDHKNADTLDNRRSNLRPATASQNAAGARKHRHHGRATSELKGISWNTTGRAWRAIICRNRRRFDLEGYSSEAEAAVAYNHAATILFGAVERPNEIPEDQAPDAARRREIEQNVEQRLAWGGCAA